MSGLFLQREEERQQLSAESKTHAQTAHLRRCGTSRHIFHLVRQSTLWNSELEDKGSCSGQTGASFQTSSAANRCQNSQRSRMAGLLNHMQDGRTFRGKRGIPKFTLSFFHEVISLRVFFLATVQTFNNQCKHLWFIYGTWQSVEALAISRRSRARFPLLSSEYFSDINLPAGVGLWPLACWDCGFESHQVHISLSLVSVVCCKVELSATG
jgi:hypothetical protein